MIHFTRFSGGIMWALYMALYMPMLLLYSVCLLISFAVMLNFTPSSWANMLEHIFLREYTAGTRRTHLPKHEIPQQFTPSICFMGGGQLWMFAIGVGHYVYDNFDINKIKFLASSSGCFAAVPLACGLDPYDWCKRDWGKCMTHFDSRYMGCLYDTKHFYYNLWNDYLPPDAHIQCSGRLFVSVTTYPSLQNKVVSQFSTREELIWTITASMCLPFAFMRDFPVDCGETIGQCLDGGFSNDSPCLDTYTITVSALSREADIKPESTPTDTFKRFKKNKKQPAAPVSLEGSPDDSDAEHKYSLRIRIYDIIRVPTYARVWEVGNMGEVAAAGCRDFQRHEWQSIKKETNSANSAELKMTSAESYSSLYSQDL